jgi:hypothetical protein
MRFLSPTRSTRAALALALSAALLAAGCSSASPAVVAYVGDAQISQRQVETAVTAVGSTVEEGQTVSQEAVINAMIQGELAAQIARANRINITDAERDTFLSTTNLAGLLNVPGARPIAYDVADQQLVSKRLGAAPYLAQVDKLEVKLNPRYGVLDPKQKVIAPEQSGSLSRPAAPQTP